MHVVVTGCWSWCCALLGAGAGCRVPVLVPGAGAGAGCWAPVLVLARGGDRLLVLVVVLGAGRWRRWWELAVHVVETGCWCWCWCCELAVHVVLCRAPVLGAGCRCCELAAHVAEIGCWRWCWVPVLVL